MRNERRDNGLQRLQSDLEELRAERKRQASDMRANRGKEHEAMWLCVCTLGGIILALLIILWGAGKAQQCKAEGGMYVREFLGWGGYKCLKR